MAKVAHLENLISGAMIGAKCILTDCKGKNVKCKKDGKEQKEVKEVGAAGLAIWQRWIFWIRFWMT